MNPSWLSLLFLFNFFGNSLQVDVAKFCGINCSRGGRGNHTICLLKCAMAPECEQFKHEELTPAERQYIADLHNHYRNLVASGRDRRGGNEAAKDMMVMNYDVDIEITTFCWINRCEFEHDKCRQHHKHGDQDAGQNLYQQSSSNLRDYKDKHFLNDSAYQWYNEIADMIPSLITSYQSGVTKKQVGHFTQMVWAKTQWIGCSRASFYDKRHKGFEHKIHVFCNYFPGGNYLGMPIYEFGSGCTTEKPNSEYKALCGEVKAVSNDRDQSIKDIFKDIPGGCEKFGINIFTLLIFVIYFPTIS